MLNRNDGFFLAEIVLSLAALLMAASVLIPYSVYLRSQLVQSRRDAGAVHVLFDELMFIENSGRETGRSAIAKDGIVYGVAIAKDERGKPQEVCVEYVGNQGEQISKCATVE